MTALADDNLEAVTVSKGVLQFIHDKGKFRDVFIKPFMRPLEVLSDIALRYSWTSYHPAALLRRTSYWHTHERFAVIANMFTDSSVPAFQ